MFFLKDLPTRRMIESYSGYYDTGPETIRDGLALLRRASLLIRRLDAYFARHGFSQLRFLFLIVIDREEDRDSLTVGEITERLDVSGPVVARTLRTLLDDGLVTKVTDENDSRIRHIALTPEGRERLTTILPGYFRIIANEMEGEDP